MKNVERLVADLIRFLKKWDLWDAVEIICDGTCYTSFSSSDSTSGAFGLSDVFVSPRSLDIKGLLAEYLSPSEEEWESLGELVIICEGTRLHDLLSDDVYYARLSKLSPEVLRLIEEREDCFGDIKEYFAEELLNSLEFDSAEEFNEME